VSYWVVVVTRNGAMHLATTLNSLIEQTTKPQQITVVDDGSTDETATILHQYELLHHQLASVRLPDRGYDIRRVPANINLACRLNRRLGTGYFMISGDDCTYPSTYANALLTQMESTPHLVVASGRPIAGAIHSKEHSPSGSGRMIRCSFWDEAGGEYPVKAGWETWLLYKAAKMGLEAKLVDDLTFRHMRERGAAHQFVYWGAAMSTLGYHPLYAIGRIGKNVTVPAVAFKGAINMFRGYLQAELGSSDPFITPFEKPFREFVHTQQSERIVTVVSSLL